MNEQTPSMPSAPTTVGSTTAAGKTLAPRLSGPLWTAAHAEYDAERTGFQRAVTHRPDIAVGAATADDVCATVQFAGEHGLPVATHTTGHGVPAGADGGVLITTGRMHDVRIDPGHGTATIAGGATWDAVIRAASEHGLAPPSGSLPYVGAAAYTLGGGIGLLARAVGYASDHVRRCEVVTADGRTRAVSTSHDPDLFWALRGGQGNFGVVTEMEIDLLPVKRIYGGNLVFPAARAREVLRTWHEWTQTVPEPLTSAVTLIAFPDAAPFPPHLRGQLQVSVQISYPGQADDGEQLLQPLRALRPDADTVRTMSYADSAAVFDDPSDPHGYRGDAHPLTDLDPDALAALVEVLCTDAPMIRVVGFRHLGGALSRPPAEGTAVGHRDAGYLLGMLSTYDGSAADADRVDHAHRAIRTPWTSQILGRALPFTFGRHLHTNEVAAGYDEASFTRLRRVKAAYDPEGRFRGAHDVPAAP